MLKGYSLPRSPKGIANIVPAPPWHFVGDMLVIEFWADPAAAAATLPEGLVPHEDAGRMAAIFVDWQSCREDRSELRDPVRAQYREFLVTVAATHEGRDVGYCPYIWVTADFSLVRGHFQGFPKKMGSVALTRAYDAAGPANPGLKPGATFCGTAAVNDRRLAWGSVTLEHTTDTPSPHFAVPVVNTRYFPRLDAGHHNDPAVHELVRVATFDRSFSEIWEGSAELELYDTPDDELGALAPLRVGRGFRFSYAYSINDLKTLEQL